jgi:uncharacterized YigZ family protein
MENDCYNTIIKPSEETLFKDRNSKFFGFAFPVLDEDAIKNCLNQVKKKHHSAGHFCYAWQLGTEEIRYRVNDDGEPNNSAGMPIFGQIQSFKLTNILIISVRYFGGTKLGVGGLINAYRTSAQITLDASRIIKKTINIPFQLNFNYEVMSKVMRIIKEKNIEIVDQKLELDCQIKIQVRKKDAEVVFNIFDVLYKVAIKQLEI